MGDHAGILGAVVFALLHALLRVLPYSPSNCVNFVLPRPFAMAWSNPTNRVTLFTTKSFCNSSECASVGFTNRQSIVSLHYKRVDNKCQRQILIIFAQTKLFGYARGISQRSETFLGCLEWLCSQKFRTQYCGHTLSRLAEIRHNRTKQSGFPTIRRRELKSQASLNTIQRVLGLVRTCRLLCRVWACLLSKKCSTEASKRVKAEPGY